jgi:hypothetical protein
MYTTWYTNRDARWYTNRDARWDTKKYFRKRG